jgi:hypothetical protein
VGSRLFLDVDLAHSKLRAKDDGLNFHSGSSSHYTRCKCFEKKLIAKLEKMCS